MDGVEFVRGFRGEDEEGGRITFVASTPGVKRDGMDLDPAAWYLDNYQRNPVVLWSHGYLSDRLPIGRAEVWVEERGLVAAVTFDQEDGFAREVESKYRRGFLNAVSVGWTLRNDREQEEQYELLDISAVPVPGDPDALMERQRVGLRGVMLVLEGVLAPLSPPAPPVNGGGLGDGETDPHPQRPSQGGLTLPLPVRGESELRELKLALDELSLRIDNLRGGRDA